MATLGVGPEVIKYMLWKQGPSYWKCFPRLLIYYSRPRFIAFALPPFIIKEHACTCSIGGVCGTQLDSPEAKRLQRIRGAHFPQRCRCTSQRVSLKVGNAKKTNLCPSAFVSVAQKSCWRYGRVPWAHVSSSNGRSASSGRGQPRSPSID